MLFILSIGMCVTLMTVWGIR